LPERFVSTFKYKLPPIYNNANYVCNFLQFFYELPFNLSNFSDCKSRYVAGKNKKTNGEPLVFIEICMENYLTYSAA